MANFHLEIVTLDGLKYEGEVERLTLRTITGDLAILARHTNYCTAVGMGTAKLRFPDGKEREAACAGFYRPPLSGAMKSICSVRRRQSREPRSGSRRNSRTRREFRRVQNCIGH